MKTSYAKECARLHFELRHVETLIEMGERREAIFDQQTWNELHDKKILLEDCLNAYMNSD